MKAGDKIVSRQNLHIMRPLRKHASLRVKLAKQVPTLIPSKAFKSVYIYIE